MSNNNCKLLRIAITFAIAIFITVISFCDSYAGNLKNGIHKIINHRKGTEIYVDCNGKIILKSDPKANIGEIKDLITKETKMLYKEYEFTFEKKEFSYDTSEEEIDYVGMEGAKIEYYDLNGKKMFNGESFDLALQIRGLINDNVFFANRVYNMTFDRELKLEGVDGSLYITSIYVFVDYVMISTINRETENNYRLLIYDKKLKLIKKLDGYYNLFREEFEYDGKKYFELYSFKGNKYNVIDENLEMIFDKDDEPSIIYRDNFGIVKNGCLKVKKYGENDKYYDIENRMYIDRLVVNDDKYSYELRYDCDYEKILTTIYDNDKELRLENILLSRYTGDIEPSCKKLILDNKEYYYIHTNDSKSYIYNDKLEIVKDLNVVKSSPLDIHGINNNCFAIENDKTYYSELSIYDKNFNLIKTNNVECSVIKNIKIALDKYYIIKSKGSFHILDYNLNEIKLSDDDIVNCYTIKIKDKLYFVIITEKNKYIYDENFEEKKYSGKTILGLEDVNDGLLSFKINDNYNYFITHDDVKDIVYVYDLDFNKIDEIDFNEISDSEKKDYSYSGYDYMVNNALEVRGDYIVIGDEYKNDMFLYKVGSGFLIKNFYYVGDLKEDYFTFVNGFYFGIMDYDLNILCQYLVFDTMDEDMNRWDY